MQPTNPVYSSAIQRVSEPTPDQFMPQSGEHSVASPSKPLFIDPQLQSIYESHLIDYDGKLRLENIHLPSHTPVQSDAIEFVRQFMTAPFTVQGTLTEALRTKIREASKRRPGAEELLNSDFMKTTETVIFSTTIFPASLFHSLLDICQGQSLKLIGGKSRQALKDTFIKMVETITQKPCAISDKKLQDFAKPCPDWDFVIPVSGAPFERLKTLQEIVIHAITIQIFGQRRPENQVFYQYLVREVICKSSEAFQDAYYTGISFGNPYQKIDIVFLPNATHNFMFEFNKIGLTIPKEALTFWKTNPAPEAISNPTLTLDVSNCGKDKGYQAGFDFIYDIIRSPNYLHVNKKGFARLILWICKGQICFDRAVLKEFHNKLSASGKLSEEIGWQLQYCYDSHCMGNIHALMAIYLNTFVALDVLHQHKADAYMEDVRSILLPALRNGAALETNTFSFLRPLVQHTAFNTRFFVNYLTVCAFLGKCPKRAFYDQIALQLTDEFSLLLPFEDCSPFEILLKLYNDAYSNELKQVFDRLVSSKSAHPSTIEHFSEEQKNRLKDLSLQFLRHHDRTMQRIGLRLTLLFLRNDVTLFAAIFAVFPDLLLEESPEFALRILAYMEKCSERKGTESLYTHPIKDLTAAFKKSSGPYAIGLAWMYSLIRAKHEELLKIGLKLWNRLPDSDKTREAPHFFDTLVSHFPEEALDLYLQYENLIRIEFLCKLMVRFKNSSVKFLAYGLKLITALDKTLPLLGVTNGRKKRSPNASEFFWIYCRSIQLIPERAVSLLKQLHSAGCLDLHHADAALEICGLSVHVSASEFIDVWNLAISFGCPLLEVKSPIKNTCLIHLCEDLSRAKHSQAEEIITHAAAQELDPEQKKRLQLLIMKMPCNESLRVYLSKEQSLELNINLIAAALQNRGLMEAARIMQTIWDDLADDQRGKILDYDFLITSQLLQDLEHPEGCDASKQIAHLRSFLERKTCFITTVNPDQVSQELAEAWGRFFISVLERMIAQPVSAKIPYRGLVDRLVSFLMHHHSYPIACKVLEISAYNKIEIEMSLSLFHYLSDLVDTYDIHQVENILNLLKWYQSPQVSTSEQRQLYIRLINRLFLANGERAVIWIQRIFPLCSGDHRLEGKVAIEWVDHSFRLGFTDYFSDLYEHLGVIHFSHPEELHALYQRFVREARCPYFCARLIANHLPMISHPLKTIEVQILLLRILQMWIQQPSPVANDDLLFCLKLYTQKLPHIWCRAFEIFSNSSLSSRSDCWLLFELTCARHVYDAHPHLKATSCLHALRSSMGSEGELFKRLLLKINEFLGYMTSGSEDEKEEACFLIFKENLKTIQQLKDPIADPLLGMQLLQTRYSMKHIELMGRLDRKIISELGRMSHLQLFPYLLSFIKRLYGHDNKLLNEAMQLLLESIPRDHLNSWHSICVFLMDYVDAVNFVPMLKTALSSTSKQIHLATGYLIKEMMNRDPQDSHEKVLVSCLAVKVAEILTEQNMVMLSILNHTNVKKWLSDGCIQKCWELIVTDKLNHGARTASQISTYPLELFRDKFPLLKQLKSLNVWMKAGNEILARLLNEKGDLKQFQKEMVSFHKTLLQYEGESTKTVPRDPIDLVRPSGKRKMVCHSREQMMRTLQNLQHFGSASIEVKRKGDLPTYSFPSAESFYEFMIEKVKGKDEIHSPDFVMRGQGVQDLPSALKQKIEEYTVEAIDVAAPEEERTLLEFETLEYIFQDKISRDLYVTAIVDLNRALCSLKTSNLDVRQFIILLCSRHLLFLIEHYSEYHDPILSAIHTFVFAGAAVDFQHGEFRTPRGKEKCDQEIFNYHNDWCHEILTTLQVKLSGLVSEYPQAFYEAMLVIYPLEIYPQELTPKLQASVIFKTISRLLQSHSSVHYFRALEIMRIHQNMILDANETLAFTYQEMMHALLRDPNYLIHEKNLVYFGPANDRKECIYIAKKPLFYVLNETLRDNVHLFGKTGAPQTVIVPHFSEVARIISVVHYNVMFDLLENPAHDNPYFDVLYIVISGLNELAKKGCFAQNHAAYRDFVMRAKHLLLPRLRKESNKKETLQFMNLPYLFLIPFPSMNRAQKEHWQALFNQLIKELLEIEDETFREYVKHLVKDHFIDSGFFNSCKTKLQEIKKIIA